MHIYIYICMYIIGNFLMEGTQVGGTDGHLEQAGQLGGPHPDPAKAPTAKRTPQTMLPKVAAAPNWILPSGVLEPSSWLAGLKT